jgi:hypothetical protein
VRSDGDLALVSACDPRRRADTSGLAVDALTLPATRVQVMLAAGGTAGDADEAFDAADCFVRAVPLDQLVANQSPPSLRPRSWPPSTGRSTSAGWAESACEVRADERQRAIPGR